MILNNERTYISSVVPSTMQSTPAVLKYHFPSNSEVNLYVLFNVKASDGASIKHPYLPTKSGADAGLPAPTPFIVKANDLISNGY